MNRRTLYSGILIGLSALVVLGIGAGVLENMSQRRYYTDGQSIHQSVRNVVPRQVLWTPPERVEFPISLTDEDYEPRFSWDGRLLYFARGLPGSNAEIHLSESTPNGWTEPEPVWAVNGPADDLGPEPSWDGSALFFYSNRDGGYGGYDIWYSCNEDGVWNDPINIGESVNTSYDEYNPSLTPDGRFLYFASNRPREDSRAPLTEENWPATVRQVNHDLPFDLYQAALVSWTATEVRWLDTLNTGADEGTPCVSPEGDFLYFSSNRSGGAGGFDLWRSRILNDIIQTPEPLPAPINTADNELDPALTAVGFRLLFSSDRRVALTSQDSARDYDIYSSRTHEVYVKTVRDETTMGRVTGALRNLGWDLLWTLLALLLILALLHLWRNFERQELSLLARCALASMLFHLLLLFLFNSMKVTTQVLASLRGTGEIQVALDRGIDSSGLSAQLLSVATGAELEVPQDSEPVELQPQIEVDASVKPFEFAPELATISPPMPEFQLAAMPENRDVETDVIPEPIADTSPIRLTGLATPSKTPDVATAPESTPAVTADAADIGRDLVHPLGELLASSVSAQPLERMVTDPTETNLSIPLPLAQSILQAQELTPNHSTLEPPTAVAVDEIDPPHPAAVEIPRWKAAAGEYSHSETTAAMPTAMPELSGQTLPAIQVPQFDSGRTDIEPASLAAFDLLSRNELPKAPHAAAPSSTTPSDPMATVSIPTDVAPKNSIRPALPEVEQTRSSTAEAELRVADRVVPAPSDPVPMPQLALSASLEVAPAQAVLTNPESDGPIDASVPLPRQAVKIADTRLPVAAAVPLPTGLTDASAADAPRFAIPQLEEPAPKAEPELEDSPPEDSSRENARKGGRDGDLEIVRRVRGRVLDAQSDDPLSGAVVRLDLPGGEEVSVTTDAEGRYQLALPELPDFFALSASVQGYAPKSENVPSHSLRGSTLDVDFKLDRLTPTTSVVETIPDVHHLGNDLFEGRINSQFQKQSEGRSFRIEFELSEEQLATRTRWVKMSLMTKGIQCPHEIWVNGILLDVRLDKAPRDGSFGEFAIGFDGGLLRTGANMLQIRAVACNGDLDDFEFVNVQFDLQFEP